MTKITLTEEQMKVVRQFKATVQVCDPQGIIVGTVDPELTPEFIAELKRRASVPGPRYTSEQVHDQSAQVCRRPGIKRAALMRRACGKS